MRSLSYIIFLFGLFFLASCATPVETETVEAEVYVDDPVGYYSQGTMDLWVREDGLFILREEGGGTPVPGGRFGEWQLLGNRLALGMDPDQGYQYRFVEQGIRRMSAEGPAPAALDHAEQQPPGQMPVMRMIGAYRSEAGSHMFTPCGTDRAFPLAVGTHFEALAELHAEAIRSQALPVFLEIDAHIGPGPAMEGDGEDEYLWLERVGPILPDQRCPY